MIILYAIPVFMLLIVIEAIADIISKRRYYRFNDAVGSLSTGMLNRTMSFATLYLNWAGYSILFGYFGYFELPHTILTWVVAFIIYDFFYYWSHRLAHVYSLFWNAHAVHHQSEEFNLTTALRQPFSGFVQGSLVYLPMVLMGFDPYMVATVGSLNLIYQFWVHTRFVPKLGWFEKIFVTPSNHRVHHGMNDIYIDKNYGGVFILWDRVFKTFQEELPEEPVVFGVRKQLNSFNPFFANFQIYWQMVKDIFVGRSLKLAVQVLISRTGERPPEIAERAPIERLDLMTYKPFNPESPIQIRLLIWTQLLFSLGYTVWFLLNVDLQPFFMASMHFLPLGLALFSMNLLLENRAIGWWVEGIRLVHIVFSMQWLPMQWPPLFAFWYAIGAAVIAVMTFLFVRRRAHDAKAVAIES